MSGACGTSNNGVVSFNRRTGNVVLTLDDVIAALGGTPLYAPVTNAQLNEMATETVKANLEADSATPQDVTLAALATAMLGSTAITVTTLTAIAVDIDLGGLRCKIGYYSTAITAGSVVTIPFPVAFSTACIACFTQIVNSAGSVYVDLQALQFSSKTTAQAVFFAQDGSTNIADGAYWIAFGY